MSLWAAKSWKVLTVETSESLATYDKRTQQEKSSKQWFIFGSHCQNCSHHSTHANLFFDAFRWNISCHTYAARANRCLQNASWRRRERVGLLCKENLCKENLCRETLCKKKWAMAPKQPSSKMSFDSKFQLTGIDWALYMGDRWSTFQL